MTVENFDAASRNVFGNSAALVSWGASADGHGCNPHSVANANSVADTNFILTARR